MAIAPACDGAPLIPKQAFEARRRQFGITNRMLDRFMPEIGLDRAGIDALGRQLKSAGVPQHVRVDLHIEASGLTGSLQHRLEAAFRKWRPALTDEDEWRFGLLAL